MSLHRRAVVSPRGCTGIRLTLISWRGAKTQRSYAARSREKLQDFAAAPSGGPGPEPTRVGSLRSRSPQPSGGQVPSCFASFGVVWPCSKQGRYPLTRRHITELVETRRKSPARTGKRVYGNPVSRVRIPPRPYRATSCPRPGASYRRSYRDDPRPVPCRLEEPHDVVV
jgi:hypothetical protein